MNAIICFLLFISFTVLIIYYALNPRTEIIKGGKLALPKYANARKKISILVRILMVCLGFSLFFMVTVPLGVDILFFKPIIVRGLVTNMYSGPAFLGPLTPILKQTITIDKENSYTKFFSMPIVVDGDFVQLFVYPHSKFILETKIIKKK